MGRRDDDDRQLAHWVAQVTGRWAARRDLSAARRKALFARLLATLTHARTVTGSTAALTGSDPARYADTSAQEPPQDRPTG